MTISKDDAFALLSKWKNEVAPIVLTIKSSIGTFKLGGVVDDFSDETLVAKSPPDFEETFEVSINISRANNFDYTDRREAPADTPREKTELVAGVLYFRVPGASLSVFELRAKLDGNE